jgi:hypothetical protein
MFVIVAQMPMFTPLVVDVGDPVARLAAGHAVASHFWTAVAAEQVRSMLTHVRTRAGRTTNLAVIPPTQLRECTCRPETQLRTPRRAPIRPRNTDPPS